MEREFSQNDGVGTTLNIASYHGQARGGGGGGGGFWKKKK